MSHHVHYKNGSSSSSSSSSRLMIQRSPERNKQQQYQQQQVYLQSQQQQLHQKSTTAADALIRKVVQVVYYLSRNGQLEHPHFMEVTLLSPPSHHHHHHHLRLRDFVERLTALRGRGMPALYSWSCKRSYKSGYVWNDLAENDVIYPTDDGVEYVLKGSELVQGCTEKLEGLRLIKSKAYPEFSKRRMISPSPIDDKMTSTSKKLVLLTRNNVQAITRRYQQQQQLAEEDDDEELAAAADPDDEDNNINDENSTTSYSFSTDIPPSRRCSVGISTDDIPLLLPLTADERDDSSSSPPPYNNMSVSSSSDKAAAGTTIMEPQSPVEQSSHRNSVLLHLIACGSSTMGLKSKCGGNQRPKQLTYNNKEASSSVSNGGNNKHTCFRKQAAVCRNASVTMMKMKVAATEEDGDVGEMEMIGCMSETNPRFGGFQTEDVKEYSSGSIVEKAVAAGPPAMIRLTNPI